MEARLAAAKQSVEALKGSIEAAKARLQNGGFDSVSLPRRHLGPAPKKRRSFQGHFGKVYAVAWGGAPERLVSASQDGKLLVWDAMLKLKQQGEGARSL